MSQEQWLPQSLSGETSREMAREVGGNTANVTICFKNKLGDFHGGAVVQNLPTNAGDTGSSRGLGRSQSPGLGRSHMPRSS